MALLSKSEKRPVTGEVGDALSDEEILPGFSLPVARLFEVG